MMKRMSAATIFAISYALGGCNYVNQQCSASRPNYESLVARALDGIRKWPDNQSRSAGFTEDQVRSGCCFVEKRRPTFDNRATYVTTIIWFNKRSNAKKYWIEYSDSCGNVIQKSGV